VLDSATLAIIARTPSVVRAMVGGLPVAALEARDAGGWNAADVIAHLVDRQPAQHDRVQRMLAKNEPAIENEDEEASLSASGLRDESIDALLERMAATQESHVADYERLGPTELERSGMHSEVGRITVADILNHRAYHDLVHIQQIAAQISAGPDAAQGAMGQFR
jgi:hypothetical protein